MAEPPFDATAFTDWKPDMATASDAITPDVIRRAAEKFFNAPFPPNLHYMTLREFQRVYGPLETIPAQREGAHDA